MFEHILRNAIAHGIEDSEKRRATGKSPTGTITIGAPTSAQQDASVVRVSIRDDGCGVDLAKVLGIAYAKGLAIRGENYSDAAIREFLFMPGFSTAASVNELAGRGVGLDVVRSSIAGLGGMVSIESAANMGTEFVLTLPTDTSSMHVVPVSANGYRCLIPLSLVMRIVPVSSSIGVELNPAAGTVTIAEDSFDLIELASRVPKVGAQQNAASRGHLVLMSESGVTKAVLVDAIGAQTRAVVRRLGPFVRDIPGMVAGTVLSNGEVGLVVNPLRLRPLGQEAGERSLAQSSTKRIMVVDDSSTVRLVTARFLRRLGFEVQTARDGLDALQQLSKGIQPDIFIFDLEMPGMGGFELIAEIKRKSEFETTPIVVISSRSADKHRERAKQLGASAYLSKPYEDSQLQAVLDRVIGLPV
ncbi:response regulator [Acidovorax carolinensis]|uniref:ATP-binding response regulator n=1 Tax=Acidovorax carolinensis TaxID=553814 RepID=UPI001F024F65|nr:response regulator [Acidovorax carolinensis]